HHLPRTSLVPEPPRGDAIPGCKSNFVNRLQSGTCSQDVEAKNTGKCRLFGRLSLSEKGCRRVWHSNNKFACFPKRPPRKEPEFWAHRCAQQPPSANQFSTIGTPSRAKQKAAVHSAPRPLVSCEDPLPGLTGRSPQPL